ncbi:TolC family outer membrane protein [Methylococcus capsulatus]|uniref:TolC family outer membrane protein n=1 Tax=Methylococcus capsulatus TaxID=414 RepID=UPI001C528A87|nr:TolC family outer membrane protein [Methylococcus capsulatus]QXP90646.1 TolC family outer membrane protein [Methylococcus capsulatus]
MNKPAFAALLLSLLAPAASAVDLLGVFDLALQYDPRLHAAQAQRDAALENKPQAVARLLPTVSATTGLTRQMVQTGDSPILVFNAKKNVGFWLATGIVQLVQPIYQHDLWVRLAQADNAVAEAEALYAAELQSVMLRVTQTYFEVLYKEASLDFARAELESINRELEQANARFEVGLSAVTDVNEAQAAADRARAGVIIAENELNNAREYLRQIVGDDPGDLEPLKLEVPLEDPMPDDIERWNDTAQQSALTIIAATNRADRAKQEIEVQFAGHYPSINLIADAQFYDNDRPPRPNRYQQQDVGMQINVPLFAGGGVNSRVRQARFGFEAALQQLDQERRAVRTRVKNAYRAIRSAIGQAKAFKTAIKSSESALEAAIAGMEVGTRTMTDVLFVQRQYYQNKRDFALALRDYIVNSVALKEAASVMQREDLDRINGWLQAPPAAPAKDGTGAAPMQPGSGPVRKAGRGAPAPSAPNLHR